MVQLSQVPQIKNMKHNFSRMSKKFEFVIQLFSIKNLYIHTCKSIMD